MNQHDAWTTVTEHCPAAGRNFFSNAFKSARPSQIPDVVTDITVTADGLLSCSLGGSVRAHPFQMQQ